MPKDETADKRIPVTPTTKQLIDDRKDPGETFDKWLRDDPRLPTGDGR